MLRFKNLRRKGTCCGAQRIVQVPAGVVYDQQHTQVLRFTRAAVLYCIIVLLYLIIYVIDNPLGKVHHIE